jgi:hypothetical protein
MCAYLLFLYKKSANASLAQARQISTWQKRSGFGFLADLFWLRSGYMDTDIKAKKIIKKGLDDQK